MKELSHDSLRNPGGSFIVALIVFVMIAATGLMLFLTTFVLWMYALTGSLIVATLIVGGCCTLAAALIYCGLLRPQLCRMQEQIDTVYEVARAARSGYEWVLDKVATLISLRDVCRGYADRADRSECGREA